jgi:hypothetical protein
LLWACVAAGTMQTACARRTPPAPGENSSPTAQPRAAGVYWRNTASAKTCLAPAHVSCPGNTAAGRHVARRRPAASCSLLVLRTERGVNWHTAAHRDSTRQLRLEPGKSDPRQTDPQPSGSPHSSGTPVDACCSKIADEVAVRQADPDGGLLGCARVVFGPPRSPGSRISATRRSTCMTGISASPGDCRATTPGAQACPKSALPLSCTAFMQRSTRRRP